MKNFRYKYTDRPDADLKSGTRGFVSYDTLKQYLNEACWVTNKEQIDAIEITDQGIDVIISNKNTK